VKWILMLLLMWTTLGAFSVDQTEGFPSVMYGGGSYSAAYHIDGNAQFPIYAYVQAPEGVDIRGCPELVCNISSSDFQIIVDLPSNIKPDVYNISVYFAANYTPPVPPAIPSHSESGSGGGGSSGGVGGATSSVQKVAISSPGTDAVVETYKRTVNYDEATGFSTYSLLIMNDNDVPTGAIIIREHIPTKVATTPEELQFIPQPSWFEQGSVIAVWNLTNGIEPYSMFAVDYKVKKRIFVLSGFDINITGVESKTISINTTAQNTTNPVKNSTVPTIKPVNNSQTMVNTSKINDMPANTAQPIFDQRYSTFFYIVLTSGIVAVIAGIAVMWFAGRKPPVEESKIQ